MRWTEEEEIKLFRELKRNGLKPTMITQLMTKEHIEELNDYDAERLRKHLEDKKSMRTHVKGSNFEREIAARFADELGTDVKRVLLSGVRGEGDVQGIPAIHIECKRRERTQINDWYEHEKGKANGKPLVIIHKRNREPVFCTMCLDDFITLFREAIK